MTDYKMANCLLQEMAISMHKKHLKIKIQETIKLVEKGSENNEDYLNILKDLTAGYSSLIHCMEAFYNPKNT